MDDSFAHPRLRAGSFELGGWRTAVSLVCAVILAGVFLASGVPKIVMPFQAAAKMMQAKIPADLSMAAAVGFGIAEVFAAVMIVVPRFRRWGAWLSGILLTAFMLYVGVHYNQLRGEDCSCFPWLKEEISPWFFVRDGAWLIMAVLAGVWARPSTSLRGALVALGAIAVFAGVSYGVTVARQTGVAAPDTIIVDGKPQPLKYGKVLLFFFDPECLHCYEAGKKMSTYKWRDGVRVIAIPRTSPQLAAGFLKDTGLKAALSKDFDKLNAVFKVQMNGPSMIYLDNGHKEGAEIVNFEGDEPAPMLRRVKALD